MCLWHFDLFSGLDTVVGISDKFNAAALLQLQRAEHMAVMFSLGQQHQVQFTWLELGGLVSLQVCSMVKMIISVQIVFSA